MWRLDDDSYCTNLQFCLPSFSLRCLTKIDSSRRTQFRCTHFISHLAINSCTRIGLMLRSTAIYLSTNYEVYRFVLFFGFHKNVIDIGFPVGDAHDLGIGAIARQLRC